MCMCTCLHGYVHVRVSAYRGQRCQVPMELELHVVVSHLMWVLGMHAGPREAPHAHAFNP